MGSMLAALAVVFVAELGDKTQLVAVGLGARHRLAPVLVGVVAGYAASTLLSVVVGGLLGAAFPARAVAIAGGALFIAFAVAGIPGDPRPCRGSGGCGSPPRGEDVGLGPTRPAWRAVVSVAVTMFVAELGDKTMLATGTLAARGSPVLVWVGATVGIVASGLMGVLVGRVVGARLPERVTRVGSAVLFAAFGVVLLATNL